MQNLCFSIIAAFLYSAPGILLSHLQQKAGNGTVRRITMPNQSTSNFQFLRR